MPNSSDSIHNLWHISPVLEERIMGMAKGPVVPTPDTLLHTAFEAYATKSPASRAIEHRGVGLTYRELNGKANSLARRLQSVSVTVGSRVAVIMERCLEFPLSLVGVLKSGGAGVPLDASFPAHRLAYILSDASVAAIVTKESHRDKIEEIGCTIPVVYISASDLETDSVVSSQVTGQNEAYIVYTSGSTGKPKGVPVLHESAANIIAHRSDVVGIVEGVRVMQFMAIGFDVCQWEVWSSLSNGATLVLRSDDVFETLPEVEVVICTPTALSLFDKPDAFPNLTHVTVIGEPISEALKDLWAPHVYLSNSYGPSECAIMTHSIGLDVGSPVTIGRPMENVSCYILDGHQRLVPIGVVGEICLGGVCVSPGYVNLPRQTSEKFLENPYDEGRLYRTGDLGRLLPSGDFEVLGRIDNQVKLKGYRIELEEVSEVIMQHPPVTAAAVIVKDKSHLVAYFTPADCNVDEMRTLVELELPIYMVPSVWVGLDVMPQNVNGKIDRNALERRDIEVVVDALETEAEKKVAQIWADVLGVDVSLIGRKSSFFSLGGDSISIIKGVAACQNLDSGLDTEVLRAAFIKS
ncbi:unnamed protein product [Aphanomyces euteiches]